MAVHLSSGNLYVADTQNNRIRKITSAGEVSTFAGDGTGTQFDRPLGVAMDSSGILYVADTDNNVAARFGAPPGVAVDSSPAMSMWRMQLTTAYGKSHRQGW